MVVCDSGVLRIVEYGDGEVIYEAGAGEIAGSPTATAAQPSPPDVCRNSVAVPDPEDRGLLADCALLLSVRDELAGTASLNWSVDTPLSEWAGVTVADSRVVIELYLTGNELTAGCISFSLYNTRD